MVAAQVKHSNKNSINIGKVRIEPMEVTPKMAKEWLEKNTSNRPLSKRTIEQYAAAIKRGEWEFNAESIKFDENGVLLDGQHRLYAISRSAIPVITLVATGLPNKVFHTLDTGLPRRAHDILHIRGEKNVNALAAALRIIFKFDANDGNLGRGSWRMKYGVTIIQIEQTLENHPQIRDSVRAVGNFNNQSLNFLRSAVCAAAHYLFNKADKNKAFEFFEKLALGYGLQKDDPILTLRNVMLVSQNSSSYIHAATTMALTIKAWNAYYNGDKLHVLEYAKNEEFPAISGLKKK